MEVTDKPEIVYVTHIATTPEKVWEALTSAAFTQQYWYDRRIESDWYVGHPILFRDAQGEVTDNGVVLVSEPPRLLSYTFHPVFEELRHETPSRVTFTLEQQGSVVQLTMVHDHFETNSKVYEGCKQGWIAIFSNLKALLETVCPKNHLTTESTIYVTYIATTAENLWEALTDAEFTSQYFFGRRIESEWQVGSKVSYWQEDGTLDVTGHILKCEPPHLLSFTWHVEWMEELKDLPDSIVTFQIDTLGEVVRLTMTEEHPEPIEAKYLEGGRRGWPMILSSLKTLLEIGSPLELTL